MIKSIFVLIILTLITLHAEAQHYNVKNFSSAQGLPESKINALCEDKRGNLWIATSGAGLLRFDGYSFVSYHKEDGLSNNIVYAVAEDHNGKLWIGTETGICTYDGMRFQTLSVLQNQTITSILEDTSHRLWFGTRTQGLFSFDGKTLQSFSGKQNELFGSGINCLHQDKYSNLWIGTSTGLVRYANHQLKAFTTLDGLPSNTIRDITTDFDSNLWIATDKGVSMFNGTSFITYNTANGLRSNDVYALLNDDKNNLWIGSSSGVLKYDTRSFHYHETSEGQGDITITSMYRDSEGNLWFGTAENGLNKLDSERFIHYSENDHLGKKIYSIIQAINGNIICGTSLGGTTVFDGNHYTLMDKREGFTSSIVQTLHYGSDSSLWVGTQDEGLFTFNKSTVRQLSVDDGFVSNNIAGFTSDKNNYIWVATADHGVSILQSQHDSLHIVKNYNTSNGLPNNNLTSITHDRSAIWLGTENAGLIKITVSTDSIKNDTLRLVPQHFTTADGLTSDIIHTVIADTLHHRIYIGTAQGINILYNNQFVHLTKANGLGSNTIYAMAIDHNQNLWAGTDRGVDMITFGANFTSSTIRHFDTNDGFKGLEVYRNSVCVDREGSVWFGSINGLVKYNPREELEAKVTPKTYITGIKLFFNNIEDTPYADSVSAWYSIPQQLTLPYNQNNLTFSFTGIHQRNPQAVRYKWMLEGFSQDWSPPLAEREATFSNLDPGTYTFKVVACNEFNIWNEAPTSYTFTIKPPFWEQWWARLFGAAILIGLLWSIFHIRLERVKAKNKIIQERLEMEKSILELEQEAARLQMNPHFIFNCLNSIQGFISINDPFQAKKYLAKFAKLMRLILENAREEFIPLQNEISILDNFLELEKLSTNPKFDFEITVDKSIDTEGTQLPPMMIQPFIENAIIHGLKRKNEKGTITVHFKIEGDLIICTLEDNGIGRKKAHQLNEVSRPNHKSTGIAVTQKRLEQYGLHRKVNAGVEFVDLEHNGNPVGTRVVIASPFEGN